MSIPFETLLKIYHVDKEITDIINYITDKHERAEAEFYFEMGQLFLGGIARRMGWPMVDIFLNDGTGWLNVYVPTEIIDLARQCGHEVIAHPKRA